MKTIRIRSALPLYAAALVWPAFGAIWPLYSLAAILSCGALSAAAYFAGRLIFKDRFEEVELAPDTGDAELNRGISEGRERLRAIRELSLGVKSPEVSAYLLRMEGAGAKIFAEIERSISKAHQARKFMNYYLPTSVKLLEHYVALAGAGGGTTAGESMERVEGGFKMIADAFERQLDNLYRAEALDASADISVLETMMASEGLSDGAYSIDGPPSAE